MHTITTTRITRSKIASLWFAMSSIKRGDIDTMRWVGTKSVSAHFAFLCFNYLKVNSMNRLGNGILLTCLLFLAGCQPNSLVSTDSPRTGTPVQNSHLDAQVVEASCGECQFKMEGSGCDLAVRIDGKSYFVDGAKLDDHGDAHSQQGMCNAIRKARVTGEIKDGRFVASAFELLPAHD
jgi:hypothetical protein